MGQEEVGRCTRRVQTAWLHLGSARNDLAGAERVISVLFGINGAKSKLSHHIGPPFPVFKARFSAMTGWHFWRVLIGSVVRVTYLLRVAEITSGSSFEPNNLKLGYV